MINTSPRKKSQQRVRAGIVLGTCATTDTSAVGSQWLVIVNNAKTLQFVGFLENDFVPIISYTERSGAVGCNDLSTQDSAAAEAQELLAELYLLVGVDKVDRATDLVYDKLHDLLSSSPKDLDTCSEIFRLAKVERLNSAIMRSLLLLTRHDKNRIWSRRGFFETAYYSIASAQGAEKAQRLLGRLR